MANEFVELPISNTIKTAWQKTYGFKGTLWAGLIIFFIVMLILTGINVGLQYLNPVTFKEGGVADSIVGIITEIISYLFQMGLLYLGLLRAANVPVTYSQMFFPFKIGLALRLIAVYIIEIIIFFVCMLVMMIPPILKAGGVAIPSLVVIACVMLGAIAFIYLAIRLIFAIAFVLERNSGPFTAISQSFKITRHNFWVLFALIIIEVLIIAVSAIPLGIGLIWSLPWAYVLYGEAYKRLLPNLFVS